VSSKSTSIEFNDFIYLFVSASWIFLFLSFHKEWKQKVAQEVTSLIQTHTDPTSSEPLHKRLSTISVSAWEKEMPNLDLVLRETVRLVVNITAVRRNLFQDLDIIAQQPVPKGHFVAYSLADAHLNPDIYTNPTEFDPTRFEPGRQEDKKQTYGYLGWGAGN